MPLVLEPGWNTFLARVHNTSGAHGLSVVVSDSPADLIRSYTQQERWEDAESVVAESANAHDAQPRLLNGRLLQARSRAALTIAESRKYREASREMMARFGTTQIAYMAERMAKASLLLPDSADRDQPLQMARFAVTAAAPGDVYLPYYKLALGMAQYRAGNYAEAIGLFEYGLAEEFKADGFRTSMAWCFLAMSQHAGGQHDKARATMAEARAFMDQKLVSPSSSEIGPAWHDWLFAQIARREAAELLK